MQREQGEGNVESVSNYAQVSRTLARLYVCIIIHVYSIVCSDLFVCECELSLGNVADVVVDAPHVGANPLGRV